MDKIRENSAYLQSLFQTMTYVMELSSRNAGLFWQVLRKSMTWGD